MIRPPAGGGYEYDDENRELRIEYGRMTKRTDKNKRMKIQIPIY
ncbi:MAG: hypothetical protein WC878_05185 [Candidatus Paceibacterota bacterium]